MTNSNSEQIRRIIVVDRVGSETYAAKIKNHPQYWAEGKSPDEAVGDLIRTHWQVFLEEKVEFSFNTY